MSDSPTQAPANGGGLTWILGATVVAGGLGYLIQAAVPAFLTGEQYVVFSVFWSVVYLVVSGLAGVQQETTRASRSSDTGRGWPILRRFASIYAVGAALVIAASAFFWAPRVFGDHAVALVAALAAAAVGYTFVAVISGALYGVRDWRGVAGMTVTDAVLRAITVGVAVLLGLGVAVTGWAVALPFAAAAAILWIVTGRGIRNRVEVDATLRVLLRQSLQTVGASIATGVMISGLPFLLGIAPLGVDAALLASLILVITLTRAPLVIPLLALQSYLVVTLRDHPAQARRRVLTWGAGLLALTAVLAGLAVFVGPWVIGLLYGDRYELPSGVYAAIVGSAGLTGLLCITGPAVLSAQRHTAYLAGWATASVVTVAMLFVPIDGLTRVLVALVAGPIVGVVVHAVTIGRRRLTPTA